MKIMDFQKKKNLNHLIEFLYKNNVNQIDTAHTYKNSHKIIRDIGKKNFHIYTKLPNIVCNIKNLEEKTNKIIQDILKKNKLLKLEGILLHDPLMPLDGDRWNIIYKVLNNFKKKKL